MKGIPFGDHSKSAQQRLDCSSTRVMLGADPCGSNVAVAEHLRGCDSCRQYRVELLRLDERIRLVMRHYMISAALLAGLFFAFPVVAHDFWVQPNEYWLPPRASVPMTLQVGHGSERQRSPIRLSRITRFEAFAPDGTATHLRDDLRLGGTADDGQLRFETPGTHVLVLETDDRGRSALPAIRFNEYARAEGLTPALEQREHAHRMHADASESYRRVAKSIVQVGPVDGQSQEHVTRPVGLTLEIVPELSPYAARRAPRLPIRVFFEGHPLGGALVKLTRLEHDEAPFEVHRTDRSGRTSFPMPRSGNWLLNVIWTKPLPASAEVDFETTFSSLSFGFPPETTGALADLP